MPSNSEHNHNSSDTETLNLQFQMMSDVSRSVNTAPKEFKHQSNVGSSKIDISPCFFNSYFSALLKRFCCPICQSQFSYQISVTNDSNISFQCSQGSIPCFSTLSSVYFFSLCQQQGLVLESLSSISTSNLGLSKENNSSDFIKNETENTHRLPESVFNSKHQSFNDTHGPSDSDSLPTFGIRENSFIVESELMTSKRELLDKFDRNFEQSERLLREIQSLEDRLVNLTTQPTSLPPYEPSTSNTAYIPVEILDSAPSSELSIENLPGPQDLLAVDFDLTDEFSDDFSSVRYNNLLKNKKKKKKCGNSKKVVLESDNKVEDPDFGFCQPSSSTQPPPSEDSTARKKSKEIAKNSELKDATIVISQLKTLPSDSISNSRLERAKHACRKLELKIPESIKKDHRFKKRNREYVAIEISGVKRQPFSVVKDYFKSIGIAPETTPSLYFLGPNLLEVIISSSLLDFFINRLVSSELPRPDLKAWYPVAIQHIML